MSDTLRRLAVLITCHNRRALTLRCLSSLFTQQGLEGVALSVFLVDDGSTDGTAAAVSTDFPVVDILFGDGNLFWNRGMHLAFARAMEGDYDFYLWLNDDVDLLPDSLCRAVAVAEPLSLVVGTTQERETGKPGYGGWRMVSRINPFRLELVQPTGSVQRCDTVSGNFVLVTREAALRLGNLDPFYSHACGDTDYGLAATRSGVPILVMPGFVGFCRVNPMRDSLRDPSLPVLERWRRLTDRRALPPRDWVYLCRKHAGAIWPLLAVFPYLKFWLLAWRRG